MLNIIKTDCSLSKRNILFVIIYCLFFSAIWGGYAATLLTCVSVYTLLLGLMSAEERDNIYELLNTLPIDAKAIVGAKYAEGILSIIIAVLASSLGQVCASALGLASINTPSYGAGISHNILVSAVTSILLTALTVPAVYKFGYTKSRLIVMVLWLGLSFACPMLSAIVNFAKHSAVLYIAAAVICLILLVLSWVISTRIYQNKD